jgi:hypothetical protein
MNLLCNELQQTENKTGVPLTGAYTIQNGKKILKDIAQQIMAY